MCCSGCFRQVSFIWEAKKVVAGRVKQVVVLHSNDWRDSVLVVLDEWSPYRGGRLNWFHFIPIGLISLHAF